MSWPRATCEGEVRAFAGRGVDATAIEGLLAALPLVGWVRVVASGWSSVGGGEGWVPPVRWRLLDRWLRMLCGRAATVEAGARVEPWGVREWIALRGVSNRTLIQFELLPATDFCEWERLFVWLHGRTPARREGRHDDSITEISRRLRPLAAIFTGRVEASLGEGEFRLRLRPEHEPA